VNPPTPSPPTPRVVVRSHTLRDALIAGALALLVLGFIAYGIRHMSQPVAGNKLTGVIVEKQLIPLKEQMVEFSGRALRGVKESEGEHVLKVRVDSEQGRVFDVPVEKSLYDLKKVGDPLIFMRPPSEQR
jgi:hypothetical protein